MKLQFTRQDHQQRAVDAVVQVFAGQPLTTDSFAMALSESSVSYASDGTIANALHLSEEQLLTNVQKAQKENALSVSAELAADRWSTPTELGKTTEAFCPHFTIEMETGTGKTYTFIQTMYELNRHYGFKKFVIVVPSVAIREGTIKNLEVTRSHFKAEYKIPCNWMLYDSARLTELRHFAENDTLSVLVINIDSFTRDANKINQKGERAFAPIEYIKGTNPIVIVDEPQNFETEIRQKALRELNPLCTLRYSATHKNPYNRLYSLSPVDAYDRGLVKQIEVDGVQADENHNEAYIEVVEIKAEARSHKGNHKARVRMDVNTKKGVERKEIWLAIGDDLHKKSKGRDVYSGYVLNEIDPEFGEIAFSSGLILKINQAQGGLKDDVMRFQIERTVAAHFARLRRLKPLGIKVLSLFFIDKVASYRSYDDEGNPAPGRFAQWFEEAFNKYAADERYTGLIPHRASEVHNGYFSGDRKGKGASATTIWTDSTEKGSKKDDDTYSLIMKDKERLLSFGEPLQFIFSHSALREGWDNPNVFQICTLNETQSALKKRQEIGRGLRLPVNQDGERIQDKTINVLTVIPNESYEAFAKALQQEIEDETGIRFQGRVKNARAKAQVRKKSLSQEEETLFQAIWKKINYQTRYSVALDSETLIANCVKALKDKRQYPEVEPPKVRSQKAKLIMDHQGVHSIEGVRGDSISKFTSVAVPDVYAYIQNRVHLSRTTIFQILRQSERLDELLLNPQGFLDTATTAITHILQTLLVDGIEYHKINGTQYEMLLPLETYLSSLYPPADDPHATPLSKTLLEAWPLDENFQEQAPSFACVMSESEPESRFAHDCATDPRVRFFFKLPNRFKIDTPLGAYTPDWAVVFKGDERVYFVAETKSTTLEHERRPTENLKIKCGEAHFKLADGVHYKVVKNLNGLLAI